MIRRAGLWVALGFILTLLAWPSPTAEGATAWVDSVAADPIDDSCSLDESGATCILQSSVHGSSKSVELTATFTPNNPEWPADHFSIFVNNEEFRVAGTLTYTLDSAVTVPVTYEIYAVAYDNLGYSLGRSPTIRHTWDKPVLAVDASPSGTSGVVGSSFTVQVHVTLDGEPLRDAQVSLTSSMSGQPPINLTAASDGNGSASFSYTREVAGQDSDLVTATWEDLRALSQLVRTWRPGPPTSTPTSPSTPTDGFTRTPPPSSPTPSDSSGPPLTSSPTNTPTETPTQLQASLDLSPNGTSTTVGRDFTVTATVSTRSGDPVPDRQVTFETTKRGEAAITRTVTTDGDGNARFTYRRSTTGSDSVQARVTVDGTGLSERILHRWIDGAAPPEGKLRLDSDVVNPGSDLRLTGSGCPANGQIEVSIEDVKIASTRADSSGTYRMVAPLPELPLGRHKIKASCAQLSTTATVDVVGVTAAMGTAGAAGVTTAAVLAFFVLLGGSIVRGLGNLGIDLPFR